MTIQTRAESERRACALAREVFLYYVNVRDVEGIMVMGTDRLLSDVKRARAVALNLYHVARFCPMRAAMDFVYDRVHERGIYRDQQVCTHVLLFDL